MVRIGKVPLGKSPAVVVTLTDTESLHSVRNAKRNGARILEVRIDRFRRLDLPSILQRIRSLRKTGMPLIATLRSRKEGGAAVPTGGGRAVPAGGGKRNLSDSQRIRIFQKVLPYVNAVDLELSSPRLIRSLIPLARGKKKCVILSYHNFKSTPSDPTLRNLIRKGRRSGGQIIKIAVTPRKKEDVARLLRFTQQNRKQNLVAIAMGRLGVSSRVLAPLFGSLLTYSFIGRPQAPGQLSLKQLKAGRHLFSSR